MGRLVQRWAAAGCVVAGLAILAGPGWALLAAGGCLGLASVAGPAEPVAAESGLAHTWVRVRAAVGSVKGWGRRQVAVATMPAAILAVSVGLGVAAGAGVGLTAAGIVTGAVSLMVGWNA